jgi:hypothetical protein
MKRLMLMLALGTALSARQEPPAPPQPGRAVHDGQFLAKFQELRVTRIQQALGLPEDRARALAERWELWDRGFMDHGRQMMELRRQFNEILKAPGSEEEKNARIKPLLDKFLDLRRQQEDNKRRFEADILQSLSPAQQVRMILLVEDVQSKIREFLREARRGGGRL